MPAQWDQSQNDVQIPITVYVCVVHRYHAKTGSGKVCLAVYAVFILYYPPAKNTVLHLTGTYVDSWRLHPPVDKG